MSVYLQISIVASKIMDAPITSLWQAYDPGKDIQWRQCSTDGKNSSSLPTVLYVPHCSKSLLLATCFTTSYRRYFDSGAMSPSMGSQPNPKARASKKQDPLFDVTSTSQTDPWTETVVRTLPGRKRGIEVICNINTGEDEISFATAKQSAKRQDETGEHDRTQKIIS